MVLVRHAEADGADESTDPGLSPRGEQQVQALAAALTGHDVRRVQHGPKRRTTRTGELLARSLGVPAETCDLLDDRTAVPSSARRGEYPPARLGWLDAVPADERDVDGGQLEQAWQDVVVPASRQDGTVVLVTHAFVGAWLVARALDAPQASWLRLPVDNATLTVLGQDRDGGWVVECVNRPT
ncbi:hypothetical protein GCM10027446_06950 [Angustibacter peucedani]